MVPVKEQIVCPNCFSRYPENKRLLVCKNKDCPSGGEKLTEEQVRSDGGQPQCPECGRDISVRLCPECGFEFSGHNASAEMLGISMVGAEHCGKSHFLTVLINSMKKDLSKVYGCSLYPLGGDTTIEKYNKQYYQPLYVDGRTLASTAQEDIEPLIYALVFGDGNHIGRTANLTFYDACGANFESVRTMEVGNRNIYNSRGILFLIDPTQFDVIRDRRRAKGKEVSEVDPSLLLSRTIHLIRGGKGQEDIREKIKIPLAVCITKMDIVRPWLDPSSFVINPSRHLKSAGFDLPDFHSTSLEIMSLIESWAGKELINQVTSQFANYGFFAFSSLGEEPTADGRVQHIQPHRVADPFLWTLYKNGIIGEAKNR